MRKRVHRVTRGTRERGAAAVEFAIVLTLLLMLVFGIIDFGRAYNEQVTLSQAAREGARLVALNQTDVVSRTQAAAVGLDNVTVVVVQGCQGAAQGTDAVVKVTTQFQFATPLAALIGTAAGPITLTGVGRMPCGG